MEAPEESDDAGDVNADGIDLAVSTGDRLPKTEEREGRPYGENR